MEFVVGSTILGVLAVIATRYRSRFEKSVLEKGSAVGLGGKTYVNNLGEAKARVKRLLLFLWGTFVVSIGMGIYQALR